MIVGNKEKFAFEIGPKISGNALRTVDIVISNKSVCYDDNSVYVPQFIASLKSDLDRTVSRDWSKYQQYFDGKSIAEIHQFILRTRTEGTLEYNIENDQIYLLHRFLNWGPTTDSLSCFIIPFKVAHYLTFQFRRTHHNIESEIGEVQSVQITLEEIARAIEETIAVLSE